MSAVDNTPTNKNFLSPLNFKFIMKRAPTINFFVQKVTLPELTLPAFNIPTPLIRIPQFGDHLEFGDLSITFRVDEDMQNYLEIDNWIRAVGQQSYSAYAALVAKSKITGESTTSEISLTILSSAKRPNYEIVFEDCFPTTISGFEMNTTNEDVAYVEASASFKYTKYEITKVIA